MKMCGKRQVGVEVEDEAALVGLVQEDCVVVPDHQLLLVLPRLLTPQWNNLEHKWNSVGTESEIAGKMILWSI